MSFYYLWENLSRSACSTSCIPVFFLFRYMGGRLMCLRCVFMTRHEYGADRSSEAAANDGIEHGTATASPPGKDDTCLCSEALTAETSPDMFTCFESSSACSRFAILFRKTGRVEKTWHFRFEEGDASIKAFLKNLYIAACWPGGGTTDEQWVK